MEYRITIHSELDASRAVMQTRRCATSVGFDSSAVSMLGTVASELVRNILKYAGHGELIIRELEGEPRAGIEVEAVDRGPGIENIDLAMQDHYSSSGTLGLGLPGVKRMMDDMIIESTPTTGTRVTARKFLP